jgi:hypothetical protein
VSIADDIDAITVKILDLEHENERLRAELEEDQARKPTPDLRDKLIKLMSPDIENQEKLKGTSPRIQEIVAVYREIYPGGMPKEENGGDGNHVGGTN